MQQDHFMLCLCPTSFYKMDYLFILKIILIMLQLLLTLWMFFSENNDGFCDLLIFLKVFVCLRLIYFLPRRLTLYSVPWRLIPFPYVLYLIRSLIYVTPVVFCTKNFIKWKRISRYITVRWNSISSTYSNTFSDTICVYKTAFHGILTFQYVINSIKRA